MSEHNKPSKKNTSYSVVKGGSSTRRPPLPDAQGNGKDEQKDKKKASEDASESE